MGDPARCGGVRADTGAFAARLGRARRDRFAEVHPYP